MTNCTHSSVGHAADLMKLDAHRDAKDRGIEQATAAALIALDARAEAERAVEASTAELARAVRELTAPPS